MRKFPFAMLVAGLIAGMSYLATCPDAVTSWSGLTPRDWFCAIIAVLMGASHYIPAMTADAPTAPLDTAGKPPIPIDTLKLLLLVALLSFAMPGCGAKKNMRYDGTPKISADSGAQDWNPAPHCSNGQCFK